MQQVARIQLRAEFWSQHELSTNHVNIWHALYFDQRWFYPLFCHSHGGISLGHTLREYLSIFWT